MQRLVFLFAFICVALVLPCLAQTAGSGVPVGLTPTDGVFSFEGGPTGQVPNGWGGGPIGTVVLDGTVVHDGQRCVRIERKAIAEGSSSVLSKTLPMMFSGKKIELRGFLRTEKVFSYAGLWIREDKDGRSVEFARMNETHPVGTTDWKEYSATLRIDPTADQLLIGALVAGPGQAWVCGLRLYVDGKLVSQTPTAAAPAAAPTIVNGVQVAAFIRKPVTVQELEDTLAAGRGKPDAEGALRLAGLRLTERMSSSKLSAWKARTPGVKSWQTLVALAGESAFLKPPPAEIPATAPPEIGGQRKMIGMALDYLDKTVPKLPDFFATRSTDRYDQSLPKNGLATEAIMTGVQPWRAAGNFSATVLYRNGKEVVDAAGLKAKKLKEEDKGLVTSGVFGPILSTVIGDAARSGFIWSHWEEGTAGPEAVFRYAVPKAGSHYDIAYQGLPGKDEGAALHQAAGYHGEVAIDPATGTVLRLTLQADLDPSQTVFRGDIMVEYGPVEIAERTYICPVRSVSLSRVRTVVDLRQLSGGITTIQSYATMLNDVVFKDYHVFRSDMEILPAPGPGSAGPPETTPPAPR